MTTHLYPLLFEPALHTRVWAGNLMTTHLHKQLPAGQPIGESWEIFWKNKVANGPLAGRTLGELITDDPAGIVGPENVSAEYPLLVKFLDAKDWLSVQVHPDDVMAIKLEGQPRGKTECWYVVHAEPGAQLAFGLAESLDAESLRAAIASGRAKEMMQYVDVSAGDFIYVRAGTMHALGPGLLIYELQQTSDTTYRVYDWDRVGLDGKPRELHLEKALQCTHFEVNPPAKVQYRMHSYDGFQRGTLIRGEYFALDKLILHPACALDTGGTTAHLLSTARGSVTVQYQNADGVELAVQLPTGTSAFIPAGLGAYRLRAESEAEVLHAWAV